MVQYRICLGATFDLLRIMMRFRTSICPCWLDVKYHPRSSVCRTRRNLGLMINEVVFLASNMRLIFGSPVITLGLTKKSLSAVE